MVLCPAVEDDRVLVAGGEAAHVLVAPDVPVLAVEGDRGFGARTESLAL